MLFRLVAAPGFSLVRLFEAFAAREQHSVGQFGPQPLGSGVGRRLLGDRGDLSLDTASSGCRNGSSSGSCPSGPHRSGAVEAYYL